MYGLIWSDLPGGQVPSMLFHGRPYRPGNLISDFCLCPQGVFLCQTRVRLQACAWALCLLVGLQACLWALRLRVGFTPAL